MWPRGQARERKVGQRITESGGGQLVRARAAPRALNNGSVSPRSSLRRLPVSRRVLGPTAWGVLEATSTFSRTKCFPAPRTKQAKSASTESGASKPARLEPLRTGIDPASRCRPGREGRGWRAVRRREGSNAGSSLKTLRRAGGVHTSAVPVPWRGAAPAGSKTGAPGPWARRAAGQARAQGPGDPTRGSGGGQRPGTPETREGVARALVPGSRSLPHFLLKEELNVPEGTPPAGHARSAGSGTGICRRPAARTRRARAPAPRARREAGPAGLGSCLATAPRRDWLCSAP